ncbi:MAG: transporter associated domain-containing protein [Acutalibacteraceae bacterium]
MSTTGWSNRSESSARTCTSWTARPTSTRFRPFGIKAETEASTINGWVIEQLDRIPEKGDSFDFENLHVAVEETEYQRTTRVRITVTPKPEAPAEEG